jgi:hypothetical protein
LQCNRCYSTPPPIGLQYDEKLCPRMLEWKDAGKQAKPVFY